MAGDTTTQLQLLLNRLNGGDAAARDELIGRACERLHRLTRKIMQSYPYLRRYEESGDVVSQAALRLRRALERIPPASVPEFFRLAACEVRRTLIDLVRHYFGPQGAGANEVHVAPADSSQDARPLEVPPSWMSDDPAGLMDWQRFHEFVETMPVEERVVVDLLWYHGLTQPEAAEVLNLSLATVKRYWMAARLRLATCLPRLDLED